MRGKSYLLKFFRLEFFQNAAKFALKEVGLFRILNFNVFLVE